MALAGADVGAELEALAAASAAALVRLRAGDDHEVVRLVERREHLLHVLAEQPFVAGSAVAGAARRAIALDAELIAALRARQAEVGRRIDALTRARHSLRSYGHARPGSAVYIERLG